ncbi:hypothetical protein [Brevibacillus parabrevis]|uniref:hypothetical protein n=1 Tax=Brevibacillus parabrevis TaxID=54914 RepID=UPI000ACDD92E|nr:hypothetical protein [Brevibacillus parabrevis]
MFKYFGSLPPFLTFGGALLAFLIPYLFYVASNKLHEWGDPPWKKNKKTNS